MSKFTPGPWYTTTKETDLQGLISCEITGKNIAVSYDPKDANLIAAAPDLYEALERIVIWMDARDLNYEIINMANKALNRVEGKGD
jgi:hypothetical protein